MSQYGLTLHIPVDLGFTTIISHGRDAYIKPCGDQTPSWRGHIEISHD